MTNFTSAVPNDTVKQVLILCEERINYLGDFCVRFGRLRYFKSFFNNAAIHLNYSHKEDNRFFDSLLLNNPYLDSISALCWSEIDFEKYDIVFYAAYNEKGFIEFLHEKYDEVINTLQFRVRIFSFSRILLVPKPDLKYVQVFPHYDELANYISQAAFTAELFISKEEQQLGDRWLEANGIKKNEKLFVIVDSAKLESKLLQPDVYFEFLTYLTNRENVRLLIFDEQRIGKDKLYYQKIGEKNFDKIIFSMGRPLRDDLCAIASTYTRFVFGPCTGLMHCSSSIYNFYVNNGMEKQHVPLLVTYTGQYPEPTSAGRWWGQSPLVSCIMLKERANRKEIVELHSLPETEKEMRDQLPCSAYSADILIDFIERKLPAVN